MTAVGETVERAIVFEDAYGYRRVSAARCVDIWLSAFDESLLQVDLGLRESGPVLYVILRFREDRFTDGTHAAVVNAGEHAGGAVVALSDLEYRERGHFMSRFAECGTQRLGLQPDAVLKALDEVFTVVPERRAEVRTPIDAPAVVKVEGKRVSGAVANLSAGGALIRTLTPPPVLHAKVEVEVKLPSGNVTAPATVVNVGDQGVSVQFSPGPLPEVKEKLAALPTTPLDTKLTAAALTAPPTGGASTERVGPYEVLSLLGSGGTSAVHFARAVEGPLAGQQVALKRLHKRRSQDAAAVRDFELEGRTLALIKNANVVKVLDAGVYDDQHCLVMELVEGRDLGQVLRRARAKKHLLPMGLACWATRVLLEALSAVHSAKDASGAALQLVHGDVSPHNLFMSKTGVIKLGDFGLTRGAGQVTRSVNEGRPTYLGPEGLDGQVTQSLDLWAAGVTLYELLTNEQPFKANSLDELVEAIRTQDPVDLRERRDECSGPLEAIVRRALEKDPAQRYATAKDFASSLSPFVDAVRTLREVPKLLEQLFGNT
ncbi:MAG: protein kinase [Myxococcaceae bacterium]